MLTFIKGNRYIPCMPFKMKEKFKTHGDVFDNFTYRNLFVLAGKGFFDNETLSPISIGKEANIFLAQRGSERVIVKIYRLETCDFGKMYSYIKPDPRFTYLKGKRRDVIFAWCQREYRNLLAAREAGIRVPVPITFMKNILVMEMIGDEGPSPKVKDLPPKNIGKFRKETLDMIEKYKKAGYAHGDLSGFNILNYNEKPVFIDFSQAMPLKAPNTAEMYERDLKNVNAFFDKISRKGI
jgi:RIO kinase 1